MSHEAYGDLEQEFGDRRKASLRNLGGSCGRKAIDKPVALIGQSMALNWRN